MQPSFNLEFIQSILRQYDTRIKQSDGFISLFHIFICKGKQTAPVLQQIVALGILLYYSGAELS